MAVGYPMRPWTAQLARALEADCTITRDYFTGQAAIASSQGGATTSIKWSLYQPFKPSKNQVS